MNFKILVSIFCYSISCTYLLAASITVNIVNASLKEQPQLLPSVDLVQLKNTMSTVRNIKPTSAKIIFENVKELSENFPLMVKAEYKGVTYNTMIPPMGNQDKVVTLLVNETTSKFENIGYKSVYAIKYTNNELHCVIISIFNNNSLFTFSESTNGIYQKLPLVAKNIEASVSVGSGKSNINWLRLTPQKTNREGVWLLPYPVKPGEKIYQVSFILPYDGKIIDLDLQATYPLSSNMQLILESPNFDIRIPSMPNWAPKFLTDPSIEGSIVEVPTFSKSLPIHLLSGQQVIQQVTPSNKEESESEVPIEIISPISRWTKLIYSFCLFIILIGIGVYLYKKPTWLIKYWANKSLKLQYKLESIDRLSIPEVHKTFLKEKYKKQLDSMAHHL